MEPRLVFDAGDIVGEGAVYDERRDALVWVDIGGKRIHRLRLAEGRTRPGRRRTFPPRSACGPTVERRRLARPGGVVGLRRRVPHFGDH